MRRILLLLLAAAFLAGLLAIGITYVQGGGEAVERRVAAVPAYARTYLRSLRPAPVMPTPPPISDARRAALLQAHLPTVIPTAAVPARRPATPTPPPLPTLMTLTPLPSPARRLPRRPRRRQRQRSPPIPQRPLPRPPPSKGSTITRRCGTTAVRRRWR